MCATIAPRMKYVTASEYARLYNITRQAVNDRLSRNTLSYVTIKVPAKRIPIEDTEYEKRKAMLQEGLADVQGEE